MFICFLTDLYSDFQAERNVITRELNILARQKGPGSLFSQPGSENFSLNAPLRLSFAPLIHIMPL